MVDSVATVTGDHCGELVDLRRSDWPVAYVTRDATDRDPRTFLIMGQNNREFSLLHSCTGGA